ncbi:MAG: hypothetical protein HKN41_00910 [Ilumatobacter sp.]|nr:hypothetical protein [Ilumatobacter sp.]
MPQTQISPVPNEEEAAVIIAAVEALWPKPVVATDDAIDGPNTLSWRFSGRWWHRDRFASAARPWS